MDCRCFYDTELDDLATAEMKCVTGNRQQATGNAEARERGTGQQRTGDGERVRFVNAAPLVSSAS